MILSDLRTQCQTLINRDDCTDDLMNQFLVESMQRIGRECRLPCMERQLYFNPTETVGWFGVPADLIEPIDFFVRRPHVQPLALDYKPYRDLVRLDPRMHPTAYGRLQAQFHIRGVVPAGWPIQFIYYGEFSPLTSDSDENEITASSPDLVKYGALSMAGDYFAHPRTDSWEQRYQAIKDQVQGLAISAEMGGPQVISPAHPEASYSTSPWNHVYE